MMSWSNDFVGLYRPLVTSIMSKQWGTLGILGGYLNTTGPPHLTSPTGVV